MSRPEAEPSPYVWQRHTFTGVRWEPSRTARAFLKLVPWIDLMACAVLVFLLAQQTLVQPGRVVEMPQAPLAEGLLAKRPTAVVHRIVAPERQQATVLLLEDGRYSSDVPRELDALAETHLDEEINLIVDAQVSHGETLVWVERLRRCGARRINLVATPPAGEAYP